MLHTCNTLSSSSITLGNINAHLDMPTNSLVLTIYSLLDICGFCQTITVPTHKLGHTLDVAIIRPTDDNVSSTTVSQLTMSDHYCVVYDLSAVKPVSHA